MKNIKKQIHDSIRATENFILNDKQLSKIDFRFSTNESSFGETNSIIGYNAIMIINFKGKNLEVIFTVVDINTINISYHIVQTIGDSSTYNTLKQSTITKTEDFYEVPAQSIMFINQNLEGEEKVKIDENYIRIVHTMAPFNGYKYLGITKDMRSTISEIVPMIHPDKVSNLFIKINQLDSETALAIESTELMVLTMRERNLIFYAPDTCLVNIIFLDDSNDVKLDVLMLDNPIENRDGIFNSENPLSNIL